jgi:hypothetical protein
MPGKRGGLSMARKEAKELIVEVDDNYEIDITDIQEALPNTFNGSNIQWLGNVAVRLIAGKAPVKGAKFKVTHKFGKRCVYYKNNTVNRLPNNNMLPVGDPPIGII